MLADQSLRDQTLEQLLRLLDQRGYDFVTVTPATHAAYLARRTGPLGESLRDVLGWSMDFRAGTIDAEVEGLLRRADMLSGIGDILRSLVRVSRVHGNLFLHSAYPTDAEDSVFLGPDSYRFADLIRTELQGVRDSAPLILDLGTGAGVGAIAAAQVLPQARIVMTDVNPAALALARINALVAGVQAEARCGNMLAGHDGPLDIVLANPPYIIDASSRLYRDGGADHGAQISIDMTRAVLPALAPGGRFILYSGSAITAGNDRMKARLNAVAVSSQCSFEYREIDPDVFGEELDSPLYDQVDRIAVIAAIFTRPRSP